LSAEAKQRFQEIYIKSEILFDELAKEKNMHSIPCLAADLFCVASVLYPKYSKFKAKTWHRNVPKTGNSLFVTENIFFLLQTMITGKLKIIRNKQGDPSENTTTFTELPHLTNSISTCRDYKI